MVNTNMVDYYIAFKNNAGDTSSNPEQGAKISHAMQTNKEKNETEAALENTKITEGITNKAEDTNETEKSQEEKIKQDEKLNEELEKLENEKKKLQRNGSLSLTRPLMSKALVVLKQTAM